MSLKLNDKKGMIFALLGFSFFSIGDVFIKFLADDEFTAVEIAFFLNLFYLPFLIILSPVIGGIKATLRTENLWLHVLRALLGVVVFIINITAFKILGLSITYALIFAAPFFATIISHFFMPDTVHKHRWIAVLMGFVGILIVLRPGVESFHPIAYLALLSALIIAITNILARKIGEHEPLMAFSLFHTIIGLQVFGVLNFWDGQANLPQTNDWLYFFAIAVCHMIGMLMTSRAFSITDTSFVAPFHYVQLLWGTGFGILIFSNVPDIWTGLGAMIIVFSGIYMIYRERIRNQHITTGVTTHGTIDKD
ncbi:MAG: DMT family transporter [Pseudomonadota bacterium]